MAILLVIEDGTGLQNANTFVGLDDVKQYALNRGVLLSNDDEIIKSQLIKACDYLNSKECEYRSLRLNDLQALAFPRMALDVPIAIKNAQMQAVIEQANGFDLMPTVTASNYVTREKIGDLEVSYADPIQAGIDPSFPAIDALLSSLLKVNCSTGLGFKTVRV